MSRRQQAAGGGLTDRLPLARGAALGAAAYVVGYILTYLFVEIEDDGSELGTATEEFSGSFGFDVGTTDVVGWLFYNSHFVDFEASAEGGGQSQTESVNLLSEATDLTIPEPIWWLVPVVALLGAGFLTAKATDHYGDMGEAAKGGAMVVVGYLPLVVAGTFVFGDSTEQSGFGQTVSVSIGPELTMAIVLAGIAYPLIFGAVGGALATAMSSSSGGYQHRNPRQQQPPYQGNAPRQGHGGQQQQGHAGQQQRGPGGHQQQGQNQGNRRQR